jgi:hypothetical protein
MLSADSEKEVDAALAEMRARIDEIEKNSKTDSELRRNLHSYSLDSRIVEYITAPLRGGGRSRNSPWKV